MIRFPNPGSDIDYFLVVFKTIFNNLSLLEYFDLDDISRSLIKKGLVSSSGYIGQEALIASTRKDRSRDPIFNQSKMYAELFRHLGWILPTSRKLNFQFSLLGKLAAETREDNAKNFLRNSIIGIVFPNANIEVKSKNSIRPFKLLLKTIKNLDNFISRDEMILGPLSINDDKDENEIQEMYEYIYKLRSKILSIDKELQIKSKNLKISINTFKNYTRFPIAILKWSGWTQNKKIGRNNVLELTKFGTYQSNLLEEFVDIRIPEISNLSKSNLFEISYRSVMNSNKSLENFSEFNQQKYIFSPFHTINHEVLNEKLKINGKITNNTNRINYTNKNLSNIKKSFLDLENVINIQDQSDLLKKIDLKFKNNMHSINKTLKELKGEYKDYNQDRFYPLIKDLFQNIGLNCTLSRQGSNYQRNDAILITNDDSVPIEIKSPGEEKRVSPKAIRQALENKIIILSRKTFPIKRNTTSLVVGYDYSENRSATLKMIDDFYKVYGIRIGIFDLQTILELNLIFLLTNKKPTWNTISKMIGFAEIKNEIFKN